MFDTLFGADVSPALKFFILFVIVLALIGVIAWLVRRFGANPFGGSSARGRQPRLAVVDAAEVDARRKLVIIRRDNVEHLLMIGGPTDVVVEQNIVRASSAPRDKGGGANHRPRPACSRYSPTSGVRRRRRHVAAAAASGNRWTHDAARCPGRADAMDLAGAFGTAAPAAPARASAREAGYNDELGG